MTATDDTNIDSADATIRLQAEALTDEGAFDKLMARGNITSVPAAVAARITDWKGLTPAEESEARRKETRERDEYAARQMEQVRERAEELRERLNEQEREIRHKIAEADARAIVLADGRRVLVGKNDDYIDEASGRKLDGNEKAEAAGKRKDNSETVDEHKQLQERADQIEQAKEHARNAEQVASQDDKSLSPQERKERVALAEREVAMAEKSAEGVPYVEPPADGDMAAALGVTADRKGRTTSYAASLDSRDAQPRTARTEFAEVAKDKRPAAPEPAIDQGLNTLSDSVSGVEVIEVHQQYKAESRIVIPKCFRKMRAQMMRFGKLLAIPETLSLILFQRVRRTPFLAALLTIILGTVLMMPSTASAMSIREYESKTTHERGEVVATAVDKIIADVARVNPDLSRAIHDYFYIIPKGQPESPGLIAFGGAMLAADEAADKGKLDRDKMQIEGILLGVVKRDVVSKQTDRK
jgi:hypothetical protein